MSVMVFDGQILRFSVSALFFFHQQFGRAILLIGPAILGCIVYCTKYLQDHCWNSAVNYHYQAVTYGVRSVQYTYRSSRIPTYPATLPYTGGVCGLALFKYFVIAADLSVHQGSQVPHCSNAIEESSTKKKTRPES